METVVTKLPESQVEIKATFDKEEWKAAQKRALRRIAGQVNIPGFRKGKAPLNMVKSRVGSGYIMQEALDMILQDSYQSVFMDNNVQPLTQPTVDAETMNADELVLVFKTTVLPEVTLGDYKGLDVKKEAVEVTDEEIDARIKNIQDQNATYVIREEDDAAQDGDVVVIDYKGSIDGEEFDGGSAENHELTLGSGQFIPGFEDQLVGVKANEEKDVTVTFPEDYMAADLAGKEAVFNVKVHEVKYKELPEVDDDLALDADIDGVETLEDLKAHLKNQIFDQKDREADNKFENELYAKLIENTPIEVPQVMVDEQVQNMVSDFRRNLEAQGLSLEQYQQITGKTMDDIKADLMGQAEDTVKLQLILGEIIKAENIEVTEEDLDAEIADIADAYGMEVKEVKDILAGQMAGLRDQVATRKATELVKNSVQ